MPVPLPLKVGLRATHALKPNSYSHPPRWSLACAVLEAQGRTFPVQQLFLEDVYRLTQVGGRVGVLARGQCT